MWAIFGSISTQKEEYAVCARDVPGLQGFWMNLLLYIHIYIYMHIYTYIYIYTHILPHIMQ